MSVRDVLDSRWVYPTGDKRQFTNAPWGGLSGRFVLIAASLMLAWGTIAAVTAGNVGAAFALMLPISVGFYFLARKPISLVTIAAVAALAVSLAVIASEYRYAGAEKPTKDHTLVDHADDGGNGVQDGVIGGGAGTTVR